MKTIETMTKDERSLLLLLEARAVDHSGRVETAHMNADDMALAKRWDAEGFVRFGRIASGHLNDNGTHWCHLSDEAWSLASAERKARAGRTWEARRWQTTEEKRADNSGEQASNGGGLQLMADEEKAQYLFDGWKRALLKCSDAILHEKRTTDSSRHRKIAKRFLQAHNRLIKLGMTPNGGLTGWPEKS